MGEPRGSEGYREKMMRIKREKARVYLLKKYGKVFEEMPELRRKGVSLRKIGKTFSPPISGEMVRIFLLHHFPESLYPDRQKEEKDNGTIERLKRLNIIEVLDTEKKTTR